MRSLRQLVAATLAIVPALALATGCASSTDEPAEDDTADSQSDALTRAQCQSVNRAYAACMRDESAQYRACVAQAERDLLEGYVETILDGVIGTMPCVGPALSSALVTKCVATYDADPVGCIANAAKSILDNVSMVKTFTKCAEKTGEDMAKEVSKTGRANLYTGLAYLAAHTTKFVVQYKTCGESFASGNDGCEPVACNANRVLCFDAPSCPTVSACKGGATHITGIFPAEMIQGGYVVGENGARLGRCISRKSMGGYQAGQCQGDKSVSLANACKMHAR